MNIAPGVGVAQLGARMHYAVPAAFHHHQTLKTLVTDFWFPHVPLPFRGLVKHFAPGLSNRSHPHIGSSFVRSFPVLGAGYIRALRAVANRSQETGTFLKYSALFAKRAAAVLDDHPIIYGFNSAFLEIAERHAGHSFLILEQTLVPRSIERNILSNLVDYPEDAFTLEYERRESAEAEAAGLIVCGSSFVRDSLVETGISASKIVVIPYGVSLPVLQKSQPPYDGKRRLRMLFAGNDALRKGLPDLLQAVSGLQNTVEVTVAGQLNLPKNVVLPSGPNIQFVGSVSRNLMPALYASHDLFVLPSLCEGSATVTYEALQAGLPVICTPNTGSVVTDGADGFLVPVSSPFAIAAAIQRYFDPSLLAEHAKNAASTGLRYTESGYGERLYSEIMSRYTTTKG